MKTLETLLLSCFLLGSNMIFSQKIHFFDEHGDDLRGRAVIVETNSLDTLISSKSGRLFIDEIDKLVSVEINVTADVFVKFTKKEIIDADFNVMVIINAYSLPAFEAKTERKSHVPFGLQNIFHEIIQEQDILNSSVSTGADLLLLSSGATVQKSQLGGGSPILRGFEANRILLVIDGVRMNNAIYRSGHLQNSLSVDPLVISACDVIYGPGAVTYGSDAIGGVIHYKTKEPTLSHSDSSLWKTNFFSRAHSSNEEISNHIDISYGRKNWAIINSLSYKNFGNQRMGENRIHGYTNWGYNNFSVNRENGLDTLLINEDSTDQKGFGYSQYDFLQKLIFSPKNNFSIKINNQLSTSSDIARLDQLNNLNSSGMPEYSQWSYGPQKRFLSSVDLSFSKSNLLFDQLNIISSYQKVKESRITRLFKSDIQDLRSEIVNVFGLSVDAVKNLGKTFKVFYGFESYQNLVKSDAYGINITSNERFPLQTRYPNGGSVQNLSGIYSTFAIKGHSFSFLGGLRYAFNYLSAKFDTTVNSIPLPFNKISNNSNALNGNINFNYYPHANTQLNIDISTGYRAPNIDDFGKVFKKDQFIIIPNNNLRAEYAYNAAISIYQNIFSKHKLINLTLNSSFFTTLLNNAIARDDYQINGLDSIYYDGQMCQIRTNVNFNKALFYGFNSSAKLSFLKKWEVYSSLSYTKGVLLDENTPMGHIPPVFGRTSINYIGKAGIAKFFIRYNGWKRIENYGNGNVDNPSEATADGTPSWATYNIQLNIPIKERVTTSLGCYNLTDIHYKTFSSAISSPGRSWLISLKLSL
jgi:hemoglobin/transferrin/lactoferrin receptor protein